MLKPYDLAYKIGFSLVGYQKAISRNDLKVSVLEKIAEVYTYKVTGLD